MSVSRHRARPLLAASAALLCSLLRTLALAPAATAAPPYAGRPLEEVLLELQANGVPLVFTSTVVTPEMRVTAEPTGARSRVNTSTR